MARVYRRTYRSKKTGQLKRVKGYTLEYRGSGGELVHEPTKIIRRPLAERLLQQRLREVERALAGDPLPADTSTWPDHDRRDSGSVHHRMPAAAEAVHVRP